MKFHQGDTVVVISGKDKGKTGRILRVLHDKERVVVAGVNMRTRHMRKTPQRPGQRIRYEASIDASNVMMVDPKTKKRTRIGMRFVDASGKPAEGDTAVRKERFAKASGESLLTGRGLRKSLADELTQEKENPESDIESSSTSS